ncbi:MAG: LysM peptidoglycan-binding domain-containing protein, partial [Anaerolineales bacterium]
DLESDPELLNKFCMDVFMRRDERKHRTGFAGFPLPPNAGESVQVLLQLRKWPFELFQADKNKVRLSQAVQIIRNSSVPGMVDAFAVFSKPSTVTQGLSQMREALDSATNCTEEWKALGRLARPFNEAWSTYAFSKAKLSDKQLAIEEGFSRAELKARHKRPRLRRRKFNARQIAILSKVERLVAVESPIPSPTAMTDRIPSVAPAPYIAPMPETKQVELPIAARTQMLTPAPVLKEAADFNGTSTASLPLILRTLGAVSLWVGAAAASHFSQQYNGSAIGANEANVVATPAEHIVEEVEVPLGQRTEAPPESTVSRLPDYCTSDGLCTFPRAYTLWRVAEECFGDGRRFGEIWDLNRATLDADPNKVRAGQSFFLEPTDCS